jgi:hypothetical protein
MSHFVLKPARLIQDTFDVIPDQPVLEFGFRDLCKMLVPQGTAFTERQKLLHLRPRAYVGRAKSKQSPNEIFIFVLYNWDRTGNIDYVLAKDPSFAERVIDVFRVEEVLYDSKVVEQQGTPATQGAQA